MHAANVLDNDPPSPLIDVVISLLQIRQYFKDSSFYVADAWLRGLCPNPQFICEAFAPSAATVKVSYLAICRVEDDRTHTICAQMFFCLDSGFDAGWHLAPSCTHG